MRGKRSGSPESSRAANAKANSVSDAAIENIMETAEPMVHQRATFKNADTDADMSYS